MQRLSFKTFFLAFTTLTIALVTLAGIASADAPPAPPTAASPVPGNFTLQGSDFDCVPAADGSGAFTCAPKAEARSPRFEMSRPPVAETAATQAIDRNYFVEFFGGITGELAALVPAAGISAAIGASGDSTGAWIAAMPLSYLLLSPFTVAAGVVLFSKEDLTYSSALAGAALGTLPGAAALGIISAINGGDSGAFAASALIAAALTFWVAPVVTMVVASPRDHGVTDDRAAKAPRVLPTAGVTADGGGATVGLIGRF